jgi:hypothetical protein
LTSNDGFGFLGVCVKEGIPTVCGIVDSVNKRWDGALSHLWPVGETKGKQHNFRPILLYYESI